MSELVEWIRSYAQNIFLAGFAKHGGLNKDPTVLLLGAVPHAPPTPQIINFQIIWVWQNQKFDKIKNLTKSKIWQNQKFQTFALIY